MDTANFAKELNMQTLRCCGAEESVDPAHTEEDCGGTDVVVQPCPEPVEVSIGGCQDSAEVDAGDVELDSLGRILKLDVTIRNVCPHRRVALAVILTEVDDKGDEHDRGMKFIVVPAHEGECCRNVTVRCVKFVLPEELDVSGGTRGICDKRNFKVRFLANYIDSGFVCCGMTV